MLISAIQQSDSVIHIYILFHIIFHYGLSQDIEYSFLCYTVGPCCLSILYIRGPQPPVPVHILLGTGTHSRRWAAGEGAKLHLLLPIAPHRSHYRLNHPPAPLSAEKLSSTKLVPVPKRLGTTAIYNSLHLLVPNFRYFPPPLPSSLTTTSLLPMSVSLFLFHRYVHLCHISDSTYKW